MTGYEDVGGDDTRLP